VEDEITGMRVAIERTVDAAPERVWDIIADVMHIPVWSPECVRTQWLDTGDASDFVGSPRPRVGARFIGHNRNETLEWQVLCEIVECDRPHSFGWLVLDDTKNPDLPSSRWRYELNPLANGHTIVRESFEHGPGDSNLRILLREHPEWDAPAVVEFRRQRLLENMTATLAAMARFAEAEE
jgi:uncharacterized protein YndB with AHSA1/START domain